MVGWCCALWLVTGKVVISTNMNDGCACWPHQPLLGRGAWSRHVQTRLNNELQNDVTCKKIYGLDVMTNSLAKDISRCHETGNIMAGVEEAIIEK
ncbi:uncharacterized protein K489DRAFT_240362 [Dissoconium aciculare CBS 342.82]|uniref:Uncharacterized protein n=1 Tax=Dissoconium aciculare CBS 342.82 TaxID=1314786 RepID=A0A6J3M662_9PEZI|nr:uncharacterized protein K489DRAFT_240362 [Dissoconium aciculare CBS 342.82]KAF1822347.1 hypothetical protein K489DRAFT_240362 [Dissoconium aciculare CBS 342.82]